MIQLRKTDGTTIPVPTDAKFVELVNEHDNTVMMVFFQVQPGVILRIAPGSTDAVRYEQLFQKQGVRFTNTMIERKTDDQS